MVEATYEKYPIHKADSFVQTSNSASWQEVADDASFKVVDAVASAVKANSWSMGRLSTW